MITINLLPHDLRPIKRTPLPYIGGAAVLILVVLGTAFVFLKTAGEVRTAQKTLDDNKQQLAALDPIVKEANELAQKYKQLEVQVQTIEEIVSDRIIWSRQLHNLSRLSKDNLWYKSINVSTKQYPEVVRVYNPQSKAWETKTNNISRQVLTIQGYVIPGSEGQSATNPFVEGLTEDKEFSSLFELDLPSIGDAIIDDVAVREFSLPFKIIPGGGTMEDSKEEAGQ